MTAQTLTKSTKITKITNDNKVSHSDSLREQQCVIGNLCEVPLGIEADASSSGVGQKAFGSGISPADWAYVKIDLFDNSTMQQLAKNQRNLRVALAIRHTQDDRWVYLRAGINSPWRNIKRGLDFTDPEDLAHYRAIERCRDEVIDSGLLPRSGKFYLRQTKGKGQYAMGLSCVVAELPQDHHYVIGIVYDRELYWYQLQGTTLTAQQRQAGVIATNVQAQQRQRVRARDLFR